jgi:ketosteroid isomerase-like protein
MATTDQDVQATIDRMTAALGKADIDGVLATYESSATVVFEPESPVSTLAALREKFEDLVAIAPRFAFGENEVILAGDIALHLMPWTVKARAPDGAMIEDSGLSVAVLRRQPTGDWLMVIDHPHGQHVMNK